MIIASQFQYVEMVDVTEASGAVIGRSDDLTRFQPDIDLAACAGRDRGVSRRHAALAYYRGAPHLIDLQSVNGTYLNEVMLAPNLPYALMPENIIRLGTLELKLILS